MTIKNFYKIAAGLLVTLALAATAAVIIIPRLLDLNVHRARILAMAQQALNRRVSYESASFSWQVTPSFVFRGITIAEKSGDATFLKADRLTFRLALLPLLHKEVHLKDIVVERPELTLGRDRTGALTIDDLLKGKPSEFSVDLRSVRIVNGLVRLTDRLVDPKGLTTSLENLDLYASRLARGKGSEFRISTTIPGGKEHTTISMSGTVRIPREKEAFSDMKFDVSMSARNLAPGRFWPYYGRHLPFEKVDGNLDFEGGMKGKPLEFTTKGNLRIRDLRLNYPEVFHAVLTPKDIRLAYELEFTSRDLSVKSFDLNIDGLRATGSCALRDIHSDDPRITARAVSSPFRLEEFRQYIPYGIIVKSVADIIERNIVGGVYRLDEGSLDGRVSQILHMERGENYNILHIRGRVDKGVVALGPDVPTVNGINGEVELQGKDFIVRGVTGNFGASPFTLEGKVTDYPLDTPAGFPFTMVITPTKAEIDWLLRQDKGSDIAFSGRSLLRLTGSGSVTDYRLAGSWDLTGADYRYRKLMHKPAGTANRLRFAARLRETEAQLTDFHYELPPLGLTASATYRYDDDEPLAFESTVAPFPVDPLLHVVPDVQQYQPSGSLQAHFSGSGNPAESDGVRVTGDVTVADFSLRPIDRIEPLSSISGTIHVTESSLETEKLTGMLGHTAFDVSGRAAGFSRPKVDLSFSSPRLFPEDIGFHAPGEAPEIRNITGSISLNNRQLTIEALSADIASTKLRVSGEVPDIEAPEITLRADFPYLRVEDLAPIFRLKRAGAEEDEEIPDVTLNARVTSAAGTVRDIPFERLDAELTFADDCLDVPSLTVGIFGGTVSATGDADFSGDGGPAYRVHYRLDHVDTARLVHVTGMKQQITGVLAGEGEVTAEGISREELISGIHLSADAKVTDGALIFPAGGELKMPHEFPFKKLQAHFSFERNALDVTSARIEAFGGVISGDAGADFSTPEGPGYRLKCNLANIDADDFFHAFDVTRDLSGHLNLQVDVTARGIGVTALKSTLAGTATTHLEKGVIRKYGFVSKIFSILNVSQLIDFRLPDVMTNGMPYDRIDGTYNLGNGKVTTEDLTMRSPSLNMTVVGESDIVKMEIDLKVGVQAFQTVKRVVSNIPIVGWLLTGGKKGFLMVYYDVKGKWGDPKVSAIPQTSMSSGILNIFKRALALPDEMVTKPGKVFLGK